MIEERVEVREGDILIIHTGYHHFGYCSTQRHQPFADEIRYMVQYPGPDRQFAVWAKEKKITWIAPTVAAPTTGEHSAVDAAVLVMTPSWKLESFQEGAVGPLDRGCAPTPA
jgi:hypothetical protein